MTVRATAPIPARRGQAAAAAAGIAIPALLILLGLRHVALYGPFNEPDEGLEAHLFQLLMPVQLVVMVSFVLASWRAAPRMTALVLGVQLALTTALIGFVFWADHLPVRP